MGSLAELKINRPKSRDGFSLPEVLVTIGVGGFAVLIMNTYALHMSNSFLTKENQAEIQQIIGRTELELLKTEICTMNFKQKPLKVGGPTIELTSLHQFDENGIQGESFLAKDMSFPNVKVTGMRLRPKEDLGTNLIGGELSVAFASNNSKQGVQSFTRTIGLNFNTVLGIVESCSLSDQKSSYIEKTCQLISGGSKTYDSRTGKCEDRYEETTFVGDKYSAQCELGWAPKQKNACFIQVPSGFNNNTYAANYAKEEPSTYSSSTTASEPRPVKAPYAKSSLQDDGVCTTKYASELTNYANDYAASNGGTNWIDNFVTIISCIRPRS